MRSAATRRIALALGQVTLLAFGSPLGAWSSPVVEPDAGAVVVELDPPYILVGDRVSARLSVPVDGASEPVFPDWSRGWGKAEVLVAGPVTVEVEGGSRAATQQLTLTAFEPGKVELPAVVVRFDDGRSMRTPPGLALEVRSVIAADDRELQPAPPAPPRPLPLPRTVWLALGLGAIVTAFAAVLAWRRKYGRDSLASPGLTPFAELERALSLLGESPAEEAFRGLSRALRRYLGRALAFHALESSSTEIQRRLAERGVARELAQRGVTTLRAADQIKFARRPARAEDAAEKIAAARALAAELEIWLMPKPAPEADPASAKAKSVA